MSRIYSLALSVLILLIKVNSLKFMIVHFQIHKYILDYLNNFLFILDRQNKTKSNP